MTLTPEAAPRVCLPKNLGSRGEDTLLVWPEHGQWMCVDEELERVVKLADGTRTIRQIAAQVAKDRGTASGAEVVEVQQVLQVLESRGLLRSLQPESQALRLWNVTINLTNRCNLSCTWCYNARRKPTPEIGGARIAAGLGRLRELCAPSASLIVLGGEPILALESLLTLADACASNWPGLLQVSTNGTMLESRHCRELSQRRIEVQVSLDGPTAAEHESIRGPGTWEAALRGVRLLQEAGVPTLLNMVYTRQSVGRIEAFLDLALRLGVASARFIPLRQIGRGLSHSLQAPDNWQAFRIVLDILQRRPEFRPLVGRDYFSVLMMQASRSGRTGGCGVGREVLFVDAEGSLYPCPNHVEDSCRIGSLEDNDITATLRTSPVLAKLRQDSAVDRIGECSGCEFRRWCGGDCRGEVRWLGKSADAASPHCEQLKRVYLEAFWLLARKDPRFSAVERSVRGC